MLLLRDGCMSNSERMDLLGRGVQVAARLRHIRLSSQPTKRRPNFKATGLAADTRERPAHESPGLAPEPDTPLDSAELQRADVTLVLLTGARS